MRGQVIARRDVTVLGPTGTVPTQAEAVRQADGTILYHIPALDLTLTEAAAVKYAGGLADLVATVHTTPTATVEIIH